MQQYCIIETVGISIDKVFLSYLNRIPCNNQFSVGNGGNAGNVHIRYRLLNGQIKLKSCRGSGAPAANNGVGGKGKHRENYFNTL